MLNKSKIAQLDSLTGTICLVYLMFNGRKITLRHIIKLLKGKFVDEDVVYQYTKKLEKLGLLRVITVEEHRRGKPRFLTSDIDLIPQYISAQARFNEFTDEEMKKLKLLLTSITNNVLDFYPQYLASMASIKISKLKWSEILSNFLFFCWDYMLSCWLNTKYPDIIQPSVEDSEKKWGKKLKSGEITEQMYKIQKNFIIQSFGLASQVKELTIARALSEEFKSIASMIKGPDDVIGSTFASKLFFISIALKDPESAQRIDFFRKAALQHSSTR